ncbi:tetratricopeptide repeat protein [Daejeonella sp. JGW-45]|uniref:tetratricopeptide repeat protein n=1 Tax=Daejeonella sp. JGW-45 TaxID=3034148 RepID=UPI0023EC6402|nr:tetratricopeptide repeat protein [Daejeonella sp. JGW-45]
MIITPFIPFIEKIWPAVSVLGAGIIKKKLFFHEICRDVGVEIHEDDFDFTYLQSLSIYLLDVEHQWGEIFQLEDVRKAFHTGYPANDMTEVRRLLDQHLHTTIKTGPLKDLNVVPSPLVDNFIDVYKTQVRDNLSPSHMESLRATAQISDTVDKSHNLLLELAERVNNLAAVPLENYMLRGDVEQLIDTEHQAQLNQIKKAFDTHQIETAQQNLLGFKERIWEGTTDNIRFKVLNNIGYSFMLLNDFDAAIPYYEQAAAINPDHAANLSSLAGLYMVKKRYREAAPLAEKLSDSHPALKLALELYALPENEFPSDLDDLVPQELRDVPELLVALINISNKRMPQVALKYAKRLYELKTDSDNFIDIYCNIVCFVIVGDHVDFQTLELLSEEDKNHLRLAKRLLVQQWEKFKNTGQLQLQIPLLERLNLLQTVLDEQADALETAKQLLEIDPSNYFATKQAGVNFMFSQRYAEAADQFAKIGSDHPQLYEFHTSWLLALGKTNRMDDAKRIAHLQLDKPDILREDQQRILNTLAFLYAENQQYEEALNYIEKAALLNPYSLGVIADKAKILRATNRNQEAKNVETQMRSLIAEHLSEQTIKDRYFAATYFLQFGKPKEAALLFETMTQPGRNHFLTYQLIDAWMRSGQKAKALPVCIDLRERFGPSPEYTTKEVAIYFHYHDYKQAEKILTEFVKHFPDDLSAQLNLAGLFHRNKNLNAFREFCNTDLSRFDFRPDQMWGYVELLRSGGYHDRCLKLLYDYRRANPSFESNQLFMNYCLADPNEREHTAIPEKVSENVAVTLVCGKLTVCYVVLDLPGNQLKKHEGEINLQDPIYKLLDGQTIGKRIALHKNQDERWQITQILPLYTHVFQQALHQNTTIYAAQSGIISGEVNELSDIENFIDRQLAQRKPFDEAMEKQEKNYEAHLLPLSTYAIFNKTSPINIYEYFSRSCGIRCALGNVVQYDQAVQVAGSSSLLVPDITALLTMFKIGLNRPENTPKFIIPHTTADLIYNYVGEKGLTSHTEHMSFGVHKGQKIRIHITAEEKQRELEHLKTLESWIGQNCEIKPCKTLLEYDSKKWQKFKDAIGVDIFESAILSLETGALMLSDDTATRGLIEEELQVKSVWTQPFVRSLVVRNMISSEDGYRYYVELIKLGHRHTTVDKDMVLHVLQKSNYTIDQAVSATVDILSGYHSDENSLQIAFTIIAELTKLAPTPKRFEELCYYLLMRFMSGRTVFGLSSRFSRLSDYYISDPNISLVKHAIWELCIDHGIPLSNRRKI